LCEEGNFDDLLSKVTNKLLLGPLNRKRQDRYFIFALCEKLKQNKIGTRESFRRVAKHLGSYKATTIHRRFYEIQDELKENNYSVEEVIRIYKLGDKLDKALEKIVSEKPS